MLVANQGVGLAVGFLALCVCACTVLSFVFPLFTIKCDEVGAIDYPDVDFYSFELVISSFVSRNGTDNLVLVEAQSYRYSDPALNVWPTVSADSARFDAALSLTLFAFVLTLVPLIAALPTYLEKTRMCVLLFLAAVCLLVSLALFAAAVAVTSSESYNAAGEEVCAVAAAAERDVGLGMVATVVGATVALGLVVSVVSPVVCACARTEVAVDQGEDADAQLIANSKGRGNEVLMAVM